MRQVKFAFCCDFLYFRSANIYSPKKGARCCNKSLTSSVLSFVVMYKRGVVMFGVVSLTMGNSSLVIRYGLPRRVHGLRQIVLRQMPARAGAADVGPNVAHGVHLAQSIPCTAAICHAKVLCAREKTGGLVSRRSCFYGFYCPRFCSAVR